MIARPQESYAMAFIGDLHQKSRTQSKMCSEFSDPRDITIAVLKTLNDFARKPELQNAGWVRGRDIPDTSKLTTENAQLNADVARLTTEIARLAAESNASRARADGMKPDANDERVGKFTYRQLVATLGAIRVNATTDSLLDVLVKFENKFVLGVWDPAYQGGDAFLFSDVAPKLATFGLLKWEKIQGAPGVRTSEIGDDFLAKLAVERAGAT
jgi:hypothetical protein